MSLEAPNVYLWESNNTEVAELMAKHLIPRSCGVLVMREKKKTSAIEFLLMRHKDRWDLPKGHVDPGETDHECALRELWEETGIAANDIEIDANFSWQTRYNVKWDGKPIEKTLIIFLGKLTTSVKIKLTEHAGYQWFPWNPPHAIQQQTIDPLLAAVANHLAQ